MGPEGAAPIQHTVATHETEGSKGGSEIEEIAPQRRSPVTQIIAAATQPSEIHSLISMPGWATSNTRQQSKIIMAETASEGENNWELLAVDEAKAIAIPEEYSQFLDIFQKPKHLSLPSHRPHDHTIPIMEGKTLSYNQIIPMSDGKSQLLKEYIEDQLKKGNI
jgi:hypothetical protein